MKIGHINHICVGPSSTARHFVIASVAKQSSFARAALDCFASLTMTGEEQAVKTADYEERFANPFVAASRGYIDEVIYPHSARRRVALGLRKLRNKSLKNPRKKHDNIPL